MKHTLKILLVLGAVAICLGSIDEGIPRLSSTAMANYCWAVGPITSDTTWSTAICDTYLVYGSLSVEPGATLTIEPGVVVAFPETCRLEVGGALTARGTVSDSIVFTGWHSDQSPSWWDCIKFRNSSIDTACSLLYCRIEYATYGVHCDTASPTISHCRIRECYTGIYCNNASNPIIRFCTVSQNSGEGITFNNNSAGLVDSCTINGNSAEDGGGICCYSSDPTLTNCTISGNSSGDYGGGIYCSSSNPTLENCTISGNSADYGGGICSDNQSNATLEDCTISGNSAYYGGGIYCSSSNATLTNCTISGNSGGDGGGICCYSSSPTLTNCTIRGNSGGEGGGICCYSSNPTLTNCTISGNSATDDGGGICCYDSSNATLTNCTISGNSASVDGGGILCSGSPNIKNCTITDNRASDKGDGIYTVSASLLTLESNNICHNGYGIWNADTSQFLQAPNQWWGHVSGPYHPDYNPGGEGDSVSYFVNPLPYLTEADTIAPPIPPVGLDTLEVEYDYISLVWLASLIGDLAGYKVYFDSDSSGFPYSDTIDVGMDTTVTLSGLTTGTIYYIAVTCYDNLGNESWYSREIQPTLRVKRGDANADGGIDLADAVYLLNWLFIGGPPPDPFEAGDANCSGTVGLADVAYIINYLFLGGPAPGCP